MHHPQVVGRGFFRRDVEGSEGLPMPNAPWQLSGTPAGVQTRAPAAGDEVVQFNPRPADNPWSARPSTGSGDSGQLLAGVRVVEFGMAAVVPEATWMLSDLGADVIKD